MIYTLTMNPSLDYIVDVDNFRIGLTNQTIAEQMLPGGKGLNVSMVLHNLGMETTTLGFVAGFTGDEIVRRMQEGRRPYAAAPDRQKRRHHANREDAEQKGSCGHHCSS